MILKFEKHHRVSETGDCKVFPLSNFFLSVRIGIENEISGSTCQRYRIGGVTSTSTFATDFTHCLENLRCIPHRFTNYRYRRSYVNLLDKRYKKMIKSFGARKFSNQLYKSTPLSVRASGPKFCIKFNSIMHDQVLTSYTMKILITLGSSSSFFPSFFLFLILCAAQKS